MVSVSMSNAMGIELTRRRATELRTIIDLYREHAIIDFAALLEEGGMILVMSGDPGSTDAEALGALGAAAFASLSALSERVGERSFDGCFQHGKERNFHLCEVTAGSLLLSVFGRRATPGLVRLHAEDAKRRLSGKLTEAGFGRVIAGGRPDITSI